MQAHSDIERVATAARDVAASTEGRFLDVGERLETAVGILSTLSTTFATLSAELTSETLNEATCDLSATAQGLVALARSHAGEHARFADLSRLTAAVDGRVGHMGKAVKGVGMLAINAKIAAAAIGEGSDGFVSFAAEIGRTLTLAEASLGEFTGELAALRRRLATANSSRASFDQHHGGTVADMPRRLSRTVEAIRARRKGVAAAVATVGERSQLVGQRIGEAVMALQIGDTTRQRIEHVATALSLAVAVAEGRDAAPEAAPLAEAERRAVAASCCRLQAAQLVDTAAEFDREVHQVRAALEALAGNARDILARAAAACGASGDGHGTFLNELEAEVSAVDALLGGFRSSRAAVDRAVDAVAAATSSLVGHIGTVGSLETDIRIMGLNTTLKCSRLGTAGRPLTVIAQELRVYANQIATEATAVRTDLDAVVAGSHALSAEGEGQATFRIDAIAGRMASSVDRLRTAGGSLAGALLALETDGERVVRLLEETVGQLARYGEIGQALRDGAASLEAFSSAVAQDGVPCGGRDGAVLERIAQSYTMARERAVHERHRFGSAGAPAKTSAGPTAAAPEAASLDDIFF